MKIYSMTATFGKLEHQTLTLYPGMNIIAAGNEWGKSTWCAFLTAMLYGLDTRAKSSKSALADKERYAPWSGAPMSGRIDLNWDGRDITIERSTKGRVPMGDFQAYETRSGLPVTELDGQNCGEMLLGVERSVFLRSGFIRQSDMNVTDDEAPRRRLNNLVTTGDENSAADGLALRLREMKNRIRHNRSGLLPMAEAEKKRVEASLQEMKLLEEKNDEILRQMDEVEDWRMALENHRDALAYNDSLDDARRVTFAEGALRDAREKYENLQVLCNALPDRDMAREKLEQVHRMEDTQLRLQKELQELPAPVEPAKPREAFADKTAEEVRIRTRMDVMQYNRLSKHKEPWGIWAIVLGVLSIILMIIQLVPGLVCGFVAVLFAIRGIVVKVRHVKELIALEARYDSDDTEKWLEEAENRAKDLERYQQEEENLRITRQNLVHQLVELKAEIRVFTDDQGLELCRRDWEGVVSTWDARDEALRAMRTAQDHFEDLKSMARHARAPEFQDRLTQSESYTVHLLEECLADRRRLENLQGQCRGNMDALGSKRELMDQLERVESRIRDLEKTYSALALALDTLNQAEAELQRRFAPRIAQRAGELMRRMTGGRYDRLTIGDDLSLRAGAQLEDTLREAMWRSDGTVDQLHLALRLAVAEELLPKGPLVLDDVLVRFDDKRAAAAMEILKDASADRQVILFTCHEREKNMA